MYDVVVIGSGAAGMMAAISASYEGKKVLLLEKLSTLGSKLKATGGGKCNLTNTLSHEEFISCFGKNGRFMSEALEAFDHNSLREFFHEIGVETHAPDGFRVFPTTHNANTILKALYEKLISCKVEVLTNQEVVSVNFKEDATVQTKISSYKTKNVIVATGGLGYPTLGANGDGYVFAKACGHSVTELYPAMTPLVTKEQWVAKCTADTIPKATIKIDMKKHSKLRAKGDLIFTKTGIRGPVVLDFSREITPLLREYGEVPLLVSLTNLNEDEIIKKLKEKKDLSVLEAINSFLPLSISHEICKLLQVETALKFSKFDGIKKDRLIKMLAWMPLTVVDDFGYKTAMITRGGVSLKEIDPKTMQSRFTKGLYFCGEVMDIDGPCGGYNLQWAFSSGFLAGKTK